MKISVIIPTYNSEKTIEECLLSLNKQTYPPHEIIVVDGKSMDSTIEIVKKFGGVKLIVKRSTVGKARNIGADVATGEILFFFESDCIADPRVLEYHAKAYEKRDDISGVMGAVGRAGVKNKVSDFVQREFMAGQFRNLNPDGTTKFVHTGMFSMYKSAFLKRKFREDLTSCERSEYSIRPKNELKILFEPRAIVYHYHPTTIDELFKQRKWYGEGFFEMVKDLPENSLRPDSLFYSALRYINFPEDYLHKAVFLDNRLLCEGCRIKKCKIETPKISGEGDISDVDICRIICLAFAAGILKQRTGMDYQWHATEDVR